MKKNFPDDKTINERIKRGELFSFLDSRDRRSNRAKSQDYQKNADKTLPVNARNVRRWMSAPNQFDLAGYDNRVSGGVERLQAGRSAARVVRRSLGANADVFDLMGESDRTLSGRENARETAKKINPSFRDLRGF